MEVTDQMQARQAVEALRSGVPNREAVRLLGTSQSHIEERFVQQLESVKGDSARELQTPGIVVAGDFGSGKSHLLEHLQHVAHERGFVCSKIVISKETPLYDPAKLYRAAVETATVPDKRGAAFAEIAAGLGFGSEAFAALTHWANRPECGLNSRFPATLFLYERVKDPEVLDRIVSFWAGDPLNVSEIRRWLRAHGEVATYRLERITTRELPYHRFRFAPRLMAAAGYAGWALLIDEVELIGRYSFTQRARSYAALARWAGRLEGESYPGLATVLAITSDFATAVLEDRNDLEVVPGKLRASGLDLELLLASQAERGMRIIARDAVHLRGIDRQTIDHTRDQVRALHARAYEWQPPLLDGEDDPTLRMRQHVRRWINEWDLLRDDPGYHVQTIISDVHLDYTENPTLETPTESADPPPDEPA